MIEHDINKRVKTFEELSNIVNSSIEIPVYFGGK
jgi:hypothetical protein